MGAFLIRYYINEPLSGVDFSESREFVWRPFARCILEFLLWKESRIWRAGSRWTGIYKAWKSNCCRLKGLSQENNSNRHIFTVRWKIVILIGGTIGIHKSICGVYMTNDGDEKLQIMIEERLRVWFEIIHRVDLFWIVWFECELIIRPRLMLVLVLFDLSSIVIIFRLKKNYCYEREIADIYCSCVLIRGYMRVLKRTSSWSDIFTKELILNYWFRFTLSI